MFLGRDRTLSVYREVLFDIQGTLYRSRRSDQLRDTAKHGGWSTTCRTTYRRLVYPLGIDAMLL